MEQILGNIFVRTMWFEKKGDKVDGHTHNFDHATMVVQGSVNIKTRKDLDGKLILIDDADYSAKSIAGADVLQNCALIKAQEHHEITALQDSTSCVCIFAHRDPRTGEVVQEWNGWMKAAN